MRDDGRWIDLEEGMYFLDPQGRTMLVQRKEFIPSQGWRIWVDEFHHVTRPADAPTRILEPSTEQAVNLIQRLLGGAVIQEGP